MRYGRGLTAKGDGTRVRLFAQPSFLPRRRTPETVLLSPPAGSVGPGPADSRMYVVHPVGKPGPYGLAEAPGTPPLLYLPPWDGPIRPPAFPKPDGHLDHLPVGSHEFELAHVYGTARFVLDVWEGFFGRGIGWHFQPEYEKLEISIFRSFDNSRAGYGFLELGADTRPDGTTIPFGLNFDVVAHELGHLIVYSVVGLPDPVDDTGDYYGFHESAADLVALLAAASFASVVDELFDLTRGNLYVPNELNRFAELTEQEQIRLASNPLRLRGFADGWDDEHDLSQPLTGALFDILVDLFHENLLDRGLLDPAVEDLADRLEYEPAAGRLIQALFDRAYPVNAAAFRECFADARDLMGVYLARCWRRLRGGPVTYARVFREFLAVDREATGGRYARLIRNNAQYRDIGRVEVGPRLAPPNARSHACSARTITPTEARAPQPTPSMPADVLAGRRFRRTRPARPRRTWARRA